MAGYDPFSSVMQTQIAQQQQQLFLAMKQAGAKMKKSAGVTDTDPAKKSSQPGTLYVNDFFTPTSPREAFDISENPHGVQVARSARQHGFQGKIEGATQHSSPFDVRRTAGREALASGPLDQKAARKAIQDYTAGNAAGLLDGQGKYLDGLTNRGAKNSAANISMGVSKASATRDLYQQASMAWNPNAGLPMGIRQVADSKLSNLASAYGLDNAKLRSQDPKVNGPERQKLQQRLLDHVGQTLDRDPAVAKEKKEWGTAVSRFEAKGNSVVISAGNEGADIDKMMASNGGRPLRAPADVSTNILENKDVTSVGATRWFEGKDGLKEHRANYSSDSNGVDIYASGSLGLVDKNRANGMMGTSFAAPRVAATMAELHRNNPGKSSAEIEQMMKDQLTHQLPTGNSSIPVLDYGRTADFLSRKK